MQLYDRSPYTYYTPEEDVRKFETGFEYKEGYAIPLEKEGKWKRYGRTNYGTIQEGTEVENIPMGGQKIGYTSERQKALGFDLKWGYARDFGQRPITFGEAYASPHRTDKSVYGYMETPEQEKGAWETSMKLLGFHKNEPGSVEEMLRQSEVREYPYSHPLDKVSSAYYARRRTR